MVRELTGGDLMEPPFFIYAAYHCGVAPTDKHRGIRLWTFDLVVLREAGLPKALTE